MVQYGPNVKKKHLVYLCHLSNLETDDYVNRENAVLSPAKAAFACFVVYSDVVFKVNVSLLTVSASRMDDLSVWRCPRRVHDEPFIGTVEALLVKPNLISRRQVCLGRFS